MCVSIPGWNYFPMEPAWFWVGFGCSPSHDQNLRGDVTPPLLLTAPLPSWIIVGYEDTIRWLGIEMQLSVCCFQASPPARGATVFYQWDLCWPKSYSLKCWVTIFRREQHTIATIADHCSCWITIDQLFGSAITAAVPPVGITSCWITIDWWVVLNVFELVDWLAVIFFRTGWWKTHQLVILSLLLAL